MKRVGWLVAVLPLVLSCQQAKTALEVADQACGVVNLVDPAGTGETLTKVLNVADKACEFVRIAYEMDDGTKVVQMVPKGLLVREARAYRAAQQREP